jgi:uncharacterized RDD family membrane protein YckC
VSDRDPDNDGETTVPRFSPAAGFWLRCAALCVDLLWIAPTAWFLGRPLWRLAGWPLAVLALGALLLLVHGALWRLFGATPGKAIFGLRVVGVDGRRLDGRQVLLRCAGYVLGLATLGLGFAMAGLNASRRGLHDHAAGTYVAEVGRGRPRSASRRARDTPVGDDRLDSGGSARAAPGGIPGERETFLRDGSALMSVDTTADATASSISAAPSAGAAAPARPGSKLARGLALAGAVVLGAVLLVGAYAKALDPLAFVEQIRSEGLDFLLPAAWVAAIALALEIFLGSALVLGIRRRWVLYPSAALVAFFLFLTGRTYYRSVTGTLEQEAGCGCFGNLVERTPAEAFWQDAALLVPALLIAFLASRTTGAFPRVRTAAVALVTLFGLGFAWKAPELPIDDLATRLKAGVLVDDLCSGKGEERICLATIRPELLAGEHLVVIADLLDPAFAESVSGLNAYRFDVGDLIVLSAGTEEEHRQFFWEQGPAFEIVEAPAGLLSPLYRKLPRSFVVRDGEVVETFAGLPALPEGAAPELLFAPTEESPQPGTPNDGTTAAGSMEGTSR